MRSVTVCMFLTLVLAGCAKRPIPLIINVPTSEPAEVTLRVLRGEKAAPIPDRPCKTPCSIVIAPDTEYEVTLRAPGYYPAGIEGLTYEQVQLSASLAREAFLVVPMQRRPARQEAAPASE